MAENGHSSLQKALSEQSEEVRARVLEVAIHAGVEPDEPWFQMLEAMGFLKVLIEDAPTDWRELLSKFSAYLNHWTQENAELLQSIQDQPDALKSLEERVEEVEDRLDSIESKISTQLKWMEELTDALDKIPPQLSRISTPSITQYLFGWSTTIVLAFFAAAIGLANWQGRYAATQKAQTAFGSIAIYDFGRNLLTQQENLSRLSACLNDELPECTIRLAPPE